MFNYFFRLLNLSRGCECFAAQKLNKKSKEASLLLQVTKYHVKNYKKMFTSVANEVTQSPKKGSLKLCQPVLVRPNDCLVESLICPDDNNNVARNCNDISFRSTPPGEGSIQKLLKSETDVFFIWQEKFKEIQKHRDAIFVLGPMGSGKTRCINLEFHNKDSYSQYAYVDTDEIMEELHGFNESLVDSYYPVARRIAIKLTDWLLEEHKSFVAEGTCVKYKELGDYMIRLKEKGYNIKVRTIVNISQELAVKQSRNRTRRMVSDDVVEDIFANSQIGLQKLQELNRSLHLFKNL